VEKLGAGAGPDLTAVAAPETLEAARLAAGLAFSTRMVCRREWIGARVSIVRTGDGRVAADRSTIVRHDRRRCAMVIMRFP
jgi:hypothetical protein